MFSTTINWGYETVEIGDFAVFSELVKDYRTTVKHCRELERAVKAEKYKIVESESASSERAVSVEKCW